jgi:hypothetical protein
MWNRIRKQWRLLSDGAVWVFGIVATFVIPPFFLEQSWTHFTRFVVAVLTGLCFIPAARWAGKAHTFGWVIATAALLTTGIASYFTYDTLMRRWTVPYSTTRVLVGVAYSDFAQNFRRQFREANGRDPSDEELVWKNAGPNGLWQDSEIESRRLWVTALYIGNVVLPTCCIIALMQALACNAARQPARRTQASP